MTTLFDDGFPMMMEREAGMPPNCPPVAVAFGYAPVVDSGKSKEAGREVYKDVEYVKIAIPGDKTSLIFQPANASHRQRFPQAYAAFKKREGGEQVEGTRIEYWPAISKSMVLTLKVMHIHTVEALAATSDTHIDSIGASGRELREKARQWLKAAEDNAATMRLTEEKEALQQQIAAMQAQMAAMQEQMNDLQRTNSAPAAVPTPAPRSRNKAA